MTIAVRPTDMVDASKWDASDYDVYLGQEVYEGLSPMFSPSPALAVEALQSYPSGVPPVETSPSAPIPPASPSTPSPPLSSTSPSVLGEDTWFVGRVDSTLNAPSDWEYRPRCSPVSPPPVTTSEDVSLGETSNMVQSNIMAGSDVSVTDLNLRSNEQSRNTSPVNVIEETINFLEARRDSYPAASRYYLRKFLDGIKKQ
jgi:hypothetical protein